MCRVVPPLALGGPPCGCGPGVGPPHLAGTSGLEAGRPWACALHSRCGRSSIVAVTLRRHTLRPGRPLVAGRRFRVAPGLVQPGVACSARLGPCTRSALGAEPRHGPPALGGGLGGPRALLSARRMWAQGKCFLWSMIVGPDAVVITSQILPDEGSECMVAQNGTVSRRRVNSMSSVCL